MNEIQKKAPNNVTFSSLMTGKQSTGMEQLNLPIDTNKKKNQIDLPSIRFELKLERPSSDKFSDFNYNKLCLRTFKAMKRIEKKPQGDEDANIPRLATISKKDLSIIDGVFQIEKKKVKELLATFRNKIILSKEMDREEGDESNELEDEENTNESEIAQNSKSKKKASKGLNGVDLNKFRYADFSHLGKGYDESDSFIDNSDAQDVHIPKNLVPKRGGFYINREKLKLATIDEVKKSKKSTKIDEVSEQSGDDSENSDETSGTEDSDDEESEEETSSSDEEMDEDDEESQSEEEDEEIGKKCTIENELASSNSESAKATVSESLKKIKKVVEDEEEEIKTDIIRDENSDLSKNKENKIVNPMDPISINSKKRKNETQSTEFTNPVDKVQAKITHSNGDFDEMQANSFKKKKIELSQEPKSTINTQILNEKNRLVNQSNIDTKPRGDDSNEYIDVEEEFQSQTNKSHLTDTSLLNNSLSRSNLAQSAVCQNLPDNLPADFAALIKKFLDLYEHIITTNTESLPPDLKSILINIYTESKRVKQQSNVFNYLSHKTGRNKDSLFRVCRRILNKDTAPNQSNLAGTSTEFIQNLPAQNQPNKPHNFATPNLPVNLSMKAENDLKIKQSPPVSPQITFGDLSEELKTKIVNLKKEYLICKQKNELAKFLEKSHIQNWIYSVDISVRNSKSANLTRLRDFCIGKLAESFDMSKDRFQKDYQTIVSQMRTKSLENTLRNKISELKREVDAEMPKHFDKYSRLMDEYSKNKLNEKNEETRKKMNPPRKKFEFTEKIRDLLLNIIQIKMSLFRISGSSPSPQNSQMDASAKLSYIDNFFETELLNLWPKNWMQKNVLLNIYQIKYCQPQQHIQHQRTASLNHAVQKAPTSSSSKQASSSTINISSKNGKTVKIEPQAPSPSASQAASSKMNMPSTPKSINQQTQAMNLSKQNVYDNVVSQHKKKTINQNMVPGVNSSQSEEFSPNPSRPSKSPQNLFQISNLIGSAGLANSPLPDLSKLQHQLNLMLPNLVQNSASLPNLSNSFSNNNPK